MFDVALKAKVNREVGRLNGDLCDLKDEEESLRIRRGRLEEEMRQAIVLRDMLDLLTRLDKQPGKPNEAPPAIPVAVPDEDGPPVLSSVPPRSRRRQQDVR
jgi:hypothetical protein